MTNMTMDRVSAGYPALDSQPNLLINGDFGVTQRFPLGQTNQIPADPSYIADRWVISSGHGMSQAVQTISGGTVANGIQNYLWIGGESAGTWYLEQRIELHANMLGGALTGSFWMWTNDTGVVGNSMTCWLRIRYGVDGSVVEVPAHTIPVTENGRWVRYTFTPTTPIRDANKVAHSGDMLAMIIGMPAKTVANAGLGISNLKLEHGLVATPFRPDDPATNLAKCQRYFWSYNYDTDGGYALLGHGHVEDGGNTGRFLIPLPVTMRIPNFNIVFSNPNHFDIEPYDYSVTRAQSSVNGVGRADMIGIEVDMIKWNEILQIGQLVTLAIDTAGAYIHADAELY